MTAEADGPGVVIEPGTPLPGLARGIVLTSAATPLLLFGLAAPYLGLIGLPMLFFLKNRLHADAHDVAVFSTIVSIPAILGSVFGFISDRWSPFGAGNRGHLIVFGLAAAAVYGVLAFAPPTRMTLLAGAIVISSLLQFVHGAASGLATASGRRHAMSGQMSTAMNLASSGSSVLGVLLGGILAGAMEKMGATEATRIVFLIGGSLLAVLAAFGAFGPKLLFDDRTTEAPRANLSPLADLGRLLKCWPIYPALLIQILWQFAPGAGIALQFHLANDLHATDAQVGEFLAIFYVGFLPVYALYAWLARRFSLRTLMWVGGVLAVPQMVSLLFLQPGPLLLLAAVPMGLLGGIGQAAFFDICMRSAPKGLEGTMMMLVWTMYWVATRAGDLWGADLYQHHGGFNAALIATICVYAAILPILLLIPRRVTEGRDA